MNKRNWPPATGSYYFNPETDEYDRRPRCRHRSSPAEPFGRDGQHGLVLRVTPAGPSIPAQAFVEWDGFSTWERLSDLLPLSKD